MSSGDAPYDALTKLLASVPRCHFAHLPTPLEPLTRLSAEVGGPPLWIKRDDCTGLAVGGNKTRKLEFLVGEALEQGADTLLSFGAVQSNHARQTAAAAARAGLACRLVLVDMVEYSEPAYENSGNVLLDHLLGAEITIVSSQAEAASAAGRIIDEETAAGRKVYGIPTGGSNAVGALGYVDCAREIFRQNRDQGVRVGTVVTAVSSAGTLAGLAAGFAALDPDVNVVGINVYDKDFEAQETTLRGLAAEVCETLGIQRPEPSRVELRHEFLAEGYGVPNAGVMDVVQRVASVEGVLLDPVYTGKAMAGLLSLIAGGSLGDGSSDAVVFLHTGGTPGLFAYRDAIDPR